MLAHHRLESNFGVFRSYFHIFFAIIGCITAIISIDAQPMHFPSIKHFFFSYNRYVVFNITGHYTC